MKEQMLDLLVNMRRSPNHISPSAYDTAWLAWLYPQSREWLLAAQHPDGSWGGELEFFHDRVLATLAAINALAATSVSAHDFKRIERGIQYLAYAIPCLKQDFVETVGFELLLPGLVKTGESLGLNLEAVKPLLESQRPKYEQKLRLLTKEAIYSPKSPVAHSLEFVGFEGIDCQSIPQLRSSNGSIHNSPAATVFAEVATGGSVEGRAYLDAIAAKYNYTAPIHAPFEIYEAVWSLYHLSLSTDLCELRPEIDFFIDYLDVVWTDYGVGFSETFVPDSDDTALGLKLLRMFGIIKDFSVLEVFEANDHFRCFPFERNISLDIHIHIIDALSKVDNYPRRNEMILKALRVLKPYLANDYIMDKWHASPYYSTSQAIIALTNVADNLVTKQIDWILKTQQDNGSWTYYPEVPTAAVEETAYALLALMTAYEAHDNIPLSVIEQGYHYLVEHYHSTADLPALWIHKVLYKPNYILEAVILSTLAKCEQILRQPALVLAV